MKNTHYPVHCGLVSQFLAFTATSMTVFGIIAKYYPHIVIKHFPPETAAFVISNAWLPITLLIMGCVIAIVAITVNIASFNETMLRLR